MDSALIIAEPWISDILSNQKIWEIRTQNTHKRGEVGLIRKGSGLIVGTAEIANVIKLPRDRKALLDTYKYHLCRPDDIINYGNPNNPIYAWVFKNIKKLVEPIPYTHPAGAVVWVKVPHL